MIKEEKIYTVKCDNCGTDANEGTGYAGWVDIRSALEIAINNGFIEHEGKHICENCWHYSNDDKIIIKKFA